MHSAVRRQISQNGSNVIIHWPKRIPLQMKLNGLQFRSLAECWPVQFSTLKFWRRRRKKYWGKMGKTSEKAKTMVILHKLKIRKKTSMLSSHVITGGCKLSLFLYGCLCTTHTKKKKVKVPQIISTFLSLCRMRCCTGLQHWKSDPHN